MNDASPLLRVTDLNRSFGGLKAVRDVSLEIRVGDMMGLIGSNGAGKTTLLHLLYGQDRPDSGRIEFAGSDVTRWTAQRRALRGMGLVFQRNNIFTELSVYENLMLGAQPKSTRTRADSKTERLERVDEMLATIQLQDHRHATAGDLSHGQQQWLEIGLVLLTKPRLLFLDEPTSGMTREESNRTAQLLRDLRDARAAEAMLVVEHNIEFMKLVSDRVTVMHRGEVLAAGTLEEVQRDQRVRDSYLGRL